MRSRSFLRGQMTIEYILLATAVVIVLITGLLAKDPEGNSLFGSAVENSLVITRDYVDRRDLNMEFERINPFSGTREDVASNTVRGH